MEEIAVLFQGDLRVSAVLGAVALFLTQYFKGIIPEQHHRYIPLPLALACVGIGVLLAFLNGANMVTGGTEGFIAAAIAVYGYQLIRGFVNPKE